MCEIVWLMRSLLFKKNPPPFNQYLGAIMASTWFLSKGINEVKEEYENHINILEGTLDILYDRVKAMVAINKTTMDNSTKD